MYTENISENFPLDRTWLIWNMGEPVVMKIALIEIPVFGLTPFSAAGIIRIFFEPCIRIDIHMLIVNTIICHEYPSQSQNISVLPCIWLC